VSLGARRVNADWTTTFFAPPAPANADNEASFDSASARFGGYLGYQQQVGLWVLGLEGAAGYGRNAKEWPRLIGAGVNLFVDPDRTSVTGRFDGNIVAKTGYLVAPNVLSYVTGGVAFQDVTLASSCADLANGGAFCGVPHSESISRTLVGWAVGGGLEVMLSGGWLARADYKYASFGSVDHAFFVGADQLTTTTKISTHTATFGLAYQFGPAAVIAKY
jgi:outer membrane immunogenic protein